PMTQYKRPDEAVFASGAKPGELEAFPDIARGWGVAFEQTAGIPPMEWFNALFKRTDEAIRYLMQRGGRRVVGDRGLSYRSLGQIGRQPVVRSPGFHRTTAGE
ncbi:hypothetical protein, partial [Pseudomonas aeruginosa]|uniref:hypothetical protein n=1 Tax=Pseudomonas aeruginosa TaxID=287 RepID=UPI002E817F13